MLMANMFDESKSALTKAEGLVKQASIDGIFVEEEQAALEEAKTNAIAITTLPHTLSTDKIADLHKKILTVTGEVDAKIAKKRQSLTRRKVALIPIWIFIFVMISAFWAKYKQLKNDDKSS